MSLLAIEILKKSRDFLLKAIDYNTQNGGVLGQINFFQNNLSEHNEAIKELEEYEQTDRLAELEKVILDYGLNRGYQVGDFCFLVSIESEFKFKTITIYFRTKDGGPIEKFTAETTKDMFDKAIKHFTLNIEPLREDAKLELDDTNQSAIYKIAGYESDGRE